LTNDQPSSVDTVSQQPCVEEETSTSRVSAADSTVGTTAADSDESEHSENQGDTVETTRIQWKPHEVKQNRVLRKVCPNDYVRP